MNITGSIRRPAVCRNIEAIRNPVRSDDPTAVVALNRMSSQSRDGRLLLAVLGKHKRGKAILDSLPPDRLEYFSAPINQPVRSYGFGWSPSGPTADGLYFTTDGELVSKSTRNC